MMATARELVQRLKEKYPGLWESLTDDQRARWLKQAGTAGGFKDFSRWVTKTNIYTEWEKEQAGGTVGTGGDDGTGGEGTTEEPNPFEEPDPIIPDPVSPPPPPEEQIDQFDDVRELLIGFLRDNQLPETLITFISDAMAQKKGFSQILAELRQTDEYKIAYPENDVRRTNGLAWMPEAEIRAYRDEARRLAREYLGVENVSQEELTNIIGSGWSLRTWEVKLQRLRDFERWGPTVKFVLEQELGHSLDDERLFAFFDDTPTPELDVAYERALMRAQPAVLGIGIRPEEEAELLRRYGISPEQAFAGYQKVVQELPRAERIGMIEAEINRNIERFPTGTELFTDTPFATLFRAIQLGDPDAIRTLQGQLAREVARFQGQGGVATTQTGSVGLLTEEERSL